MTLILTSISFEVPFDDSEDGTEGHLVFNHGAVRVPASGEALQILMAYKDAAAPGVGHYEAEFSASEEPSPRRMPAPDIDDGVDQL